MFKRVCCFLLILSLLFVSSCKKSEPTNNSKDDNTSTNSEQVDNTHSNVSDTSSDEESSSNNDSTSQPVQAEKDLGISQYIGKNINEAVNKYGRDYYTDYLSGGIFLKFDNLSALFFYNTETGKIFTISSYEKLQITNKISTDMNYNQLRSVAEIGEIEEYYNEMDDVKEYSATIDAKDYFINFIWHTDPYSTKPYEANIVLSNYNIESADISKGSTAVITEPKEADSKKLSFKNLPKQFILSSGVGAWSTDLTISEDGKFVGYYHDSDEGDAGDGHPNGTRYYNKFEGQFSQPYQINKYIYKVKLLSFKSTLDDKTQTEYIEDGVLYIPSEPHGFDGFKEFYLYLPGINQSMLPEDCLNWYQSLEPNFDKYILCGADSKYPFIESVFQQTF